MSEWKRKRFWRVAAVAREGDGFAIELDGRKVRTPGKALLNVPTEPLAHAIAAEWEAQSDEIDPLSMPFTRSANAAIDKVRQQRDEVIEMLAAYADTDLLCYRAGAPDTLVERQSMAWDPALAWAKRELGVSLAPRVGVIHAPQSVEALAVVGCLIAAHDDFRLTALHDLISLSGSAILGIAASLDWRPAVEIWDLSRLDEIWQEEHWGKDSDAAAAVLHNRALFLHAKALFDLASPEP